MRRFVLVVVIALMMAVSGAAAPFGAGGVAEDEAPTTIDDADATPEDREPARQTNSGPASDRVDLVEFGGEDDGSDGPLPEEPREAAETGVEEGLELVQEQGVTITQEQRQAAIDGAVEAASQHQEASVEQVQSATKGAVHGALLQSQEINVSQTQSVVAGSAGGALLQHQSANVTQLQSAAWGASHGAVSQQQSVTVEQLQHAARGAAAGAAHEAAENEVSRVGKIQEAAQGAAHGALDHFGEQRITIVQRQRITVEQVQHAAAGAAGGALASQEQRITVEQEQQIQVTQKERVSIKKVQAAAIGAAKGALVQKQRVHVEQIQAAAKGAAEGCLTLRQIQRVSVTQLQQATFGAAKGAVYQGQEATIEQIHAAAAGSAHGVLVQSQRVSVEQIQQAATGAAMGAVESAVQHQVVQVEQIQAAAMGAAEGAVTQIQVVNVVQVQTIARGASRGVLSGAEQASTGQLYAAAKRTCLAVTEVVQRQRITVEQVQSLTERTATDTIAYAVEQQVEDEQRLAERANEEATENVEAVELLEGDARLTFADQPSEGDAVTIESVELEAGGFVAVHADALFDVDPTESVIGVSEYLEPGEHENVEVRLFEVPGAGAERAALGASVGVEEPPEELDDGEYALFAVAHHDTNDNQQFDYAASEGQEDAAYVDVGGALAADQAIVTVGEEQETPTPDAATPTPEPDTPTPEVDTPTPGEDTPDPGTPTPEAETPTPEQETPTPEADVGTPTPAAPEDIPDEELRLLQPNVPAEGDLETFDQYDVYGVEVAAGDSIAVAANRSGGSGEFYVVIYDAAGTVLAEEFVEPDGTVTVTATVEEAGTYFVGVTGATEDAAGPYSLALVDEAVIEEPPNATDDQPPNATDDQPDDATAEELSMLQQGVPVDGDLETFDQYDVYGVEVAAGDPVAVELDRAGGSGEFYVVVYDAAGTVLAEEFVPSDDVTSIVAAVEEAGTYYVGVTGATEDAAGPYSLALVDEAVIEEPPNATDDRPDNATTEDLPMLESGVPVEGALETPDQYDVYGVEAAAGDSITAELDRAGGSGDLYVIIYDAAGTVLGAELVGPDGTVTVTATVEEAGTYYVGVTGASEDAAGPYSLALVDEAIVEEPDESS